MGNNILRKSTPCEVRPQEQNGLVASLQLMSNYLDENFFSAKSFCSLFLLKRYT